MKKMKEFHGALFDPVDIMLIVRPDPSRFGRNNFHVKFAGDIKHSFYYPTTEDAEAGCDDFIKQFTGEDDDS